MKVIYVDADNLHKIQQDSQPVAVALGNFDGVHLGHQKVIQMAKKKARERQILSAVLSFYPHPKSILQPNVPLSYLEPIEQKIEKLEKMGVDIFYIVRFTKELASLEPDYFLEHYIKALNAKEIICGFDYRYGSKSAGDVKTLAEYAKQNQMGHTIVEALMWNDKKISSTLIRQCLKNKNLKDIVPLMGSFYQTKYCKKNGVLPNYSLPGNGEYRVLIEQNGSLLEHYVTVESASRISIHTQPLSTFPNELTIQWVDAIET